MIESYPIQTTNSSALERSCLVMLKYYLGQRQYGPFLASIGSDSCLVEIHHPLEVLLGGHHRHCEVRARLTNRADQLPPLLCNGHKRMQDPGTGLDDPLLTSLLALRQALVSLALTLDVITKASDLDLGLGEIRWITPLGTNIPAGVAAIKRRNEVLVVVGNGRTGLDLGDHLVLLDDVDRELETEVTLGMLLCPGGIAIFLPSFGRFPVSRRRTVTNQILLFLAQVLFGRRHEGGVNDLISTDDESLGQQLKVHAIKQSLHHRLPDAVLKFPDLCSIWNVAGLTQRAEALVAHPIQMLAFHLLVGKVVQPHEHQDSHHRLGLKRRAAALWADDRMRHHTIHVRRQGSKVDARLDLGRGIAQSAALPAVSIGSKRVCLDGGADFHRAVSH